MLAVLTVGFLQTKYGQYFLTSFFNFVLLYKYTALFLIGYVAALVIPIPASSSLATAGAFASQGYLNIFAVLGVALAANVAGDATGFLLARRYGEEVLAKIGFRRLLGSREYHRFKDYMQDYPQSVIFFSRFLTEVGPAVNLLSGLAKVSYRKYFTFEVLGETCYVLAYGLVGYFLGTRWENNLRFFTIAGITIVSIGVIINGIQIYLYRKRTRENTKY